MLTTALFLLVPLSMAGIWTIAREYLLLNTVSSTGRSTGTRLKTKRTVAAWNNVTGAKSEHGATMKIKPNKTPTTEELETFVGVRERQEQHQEKQQTMSNTEAGLISTVSTPDDLIVAKNASSLSKIQEELAISEEAVPSCPTPNMDAALSCLRKSTPDMGNLSYPPNPLEHVARIHHVMQQWVNHTRGYHCAAGYCGPWLENEWIDMFLPNITAPSGCLSDTFGPYIPLLISWTDVWVKSAGRGYHYPKGFVRKLQKVLRRQYLYGAYKLYTLLVLFVGSLVRMVVMGTSTRCIWY